MVPAWPQLGNIPGHGLCVQHFSVVSGTSAASSRMCPALVAPSQRCGSATTTGAERYEEGSNNTQWKLRFSPNCLFIGMIPLRSHFPQGEGIIIPSADEVRDVRTKSLCWVQKQNSYCCGKCWSEEQLYPPIPCFGVIFQLGPGWVPLVPMAGGGGRTTFMPKALCGTTTDPAVSPGSAGHMCHGQESPVVTWVRGGCAVCIKAGRMTGGLHSVLYIMEDHTGG